MAQLTFFDTGHVYEVDGQRIPSVSEVMRFASREVYSGIDQWRLDNAADRGTRVHDATLAIDANGSADVDADIAQYVEAYVGFLKKFHPRYIASELALADTQAWFAGRLDRCAIINKKCVLMDIKTSARIETRLVQAQLTAYAWLWERNRTEKLDELYVLHLMGGGQFRFRRIERDDKYWSALLTLQHKFTKKGEFAPWKTTK